MKKLILIAMLVTLVGCDLDKNNPVDALAIRKCSEVGAERISKNWDIIKFNYTCFDKNGKNIANIEQEPWYDISVSLSDLQN